MKQHSLLISSPAWVEVYCFDKGYKLQKGGVKVNPGIIEAAISIKTQFGCYAWGNGSQIFYVGSFSKDRQSKSFKSNLHGRIHNYLRNHKTKKNGNKNTNLHVFDSINVELRNGAVKLLLFSLKSLTLNGVTYLYEQFSSNTDLVLVVERLLITILRANDECKWNRS